MCPVLMQCVKSPAVQMCLLAAMCIALTSSCNAAWVYGTSVKTSPYVGLSGNLSDVAHLMKDQVGCLDAHSRFMGKGHARKVLITQECRGPCQT